MRDGAFFNRIPRPILFGLVFGIGFNSFFLMIGFICMILSKTADATTCLFPMMPAVFFALPPIIASNILGANAAGKITSIFIFLIWYFGIGTIIGYFVFWFLDKKREIDYDKDDLFKVSHGPINL